MAHSYGGVLLTRASGAGNPITTASMTVTMLDTVVCLLLKGVGATNRAGAAPTWNGQTFVQANSTQKAAVSPEASAELWYLLNPLVGSGAITIPNTGAITVFWEAVSGRAAGGGHSAFDQANGGNNTSTNPTPGSVTTNTDGDFLVAVTAGGWQAWAPSPQAGTAITNADDGADGYGSQYNLQSTKGALDLNWTFGTSDDWGAVVAAFKEIPPLTWNNFEFVKAGSGMSVTEKIR